MSQDLRDILQTTLGNAFVVERELTGGGMSRVFVATETALGRRVAIKLLPPELANAVSAERFRREIQVVAQLQHPHIVPVHTAGEGKDILFYTMPFVEGETLRARLQRETRLPLADATRIFSELVDALAYAHAHGVVHRDLKPENVLLSGGHSMLTDFGIAKALSEATGAGQLTTAGLVLGTPMYMAPEQIGGDGHIDHRADLYALGLVGYEMLAGRLPFEAATMQAMLAAHLSATPRPLVSLRPGVDPRLVALIHACLEKDAARRPHSAVEIAAALATITSTPERRAVRGRWRAAAVVAVLAVLGGAGWWATRRPPALDSIAVLPFENAGGDPGDAYFADGISEDLTNALAKVKGLTVTPRTSAANAFKLWGKSDDLRALGGRLNVATVLDGRVRRDGARLRVTAQLTSVRDGSVLWSETYDRQPKDQFALQDELTRAIVDRLRLQLGMARTAKGRSTNLAAYDLYMRGRYLWNQRTRIGLTGAVKSFDEAIQLDSSFAAAHAGLADAWALSGIFGYDSPAIAFPKARIAADRAVELDSLLAEPHVSRGLVACFYEWDWDRAGREYSRAIGLDSTYATAWLFRAWLEAFEGHHEQALTTMRHGQQLSPLDLTIAARVGTILFYLNRPDEAEREYRAAMQLDPNAFIVRSELGILLTTRGRYDEAMRTSPPVTGDFSRLEAGARGYLLGRMGRTAEARQLIDSLQAYRARRFVPRDAIALTYMGLGDAESAMRELERAVNEDRSWGALLVQLDPRYAPITRHARFAALQRALHVEHVALSPALTQR